MLDKLLKFLRKLSVKERDGLELLFMRLKAGDTVGMDIKRLVGFDNLFRLRHGRIRVIYENQSAKTRILKVAFRDDKTYKDL